MENIFIETLSLYNFDDTVAKLSETILDGGWKISITHDLQETLMKSGIEVLPVKVIELCNPQLASQILGVSDLRLYSSMLPCRISVYKKGDGKTYISILNFATFAVQIGGTAETVMKEAFLSAEEFALVVTQK